MKLLTNYDFKSEHNYHRNNEYKYLDNLWFDILGLYKDNLNYNIYPLVVIMLHKYTINTLWYMCLILCDICVIILLYILHINCMNPYWKLDLWAVLTCDLLEVSIFYMPFCSSLDITFMPSKYFWNVEVSGRTLPSLVFYFLKSFWN